ncbi:hydroxylase [Streptomyces cinnamoneus]|uniref:Hydroxylase n=1 Tax=Streptomyces cinnamoneus TaxID=53446 RepID=A0A2G1XDB3_STRCJ|nr:VOC family protein [Streptomyces cinnamoneus]PHQ49159.1 hydroxylase [Streptomyces cinnamoneus]PPT15191.1 VOC family protein [Streptomyces cinnamoneus]
MLTTDFVTGAPTWLDLGSPDTQGASAFYGAVFGWQTDSAGPDAGGYGFFKKDGRTIAGLGPLTDEGASSAWTVYFGTTDADATAREVEKGGGTVRVEPFDVMEAGRMACFTDPGGAEFAVWQPGTVKGLEKVMDPGSLCWAELHTADPTAAKAFYRGLFDWRSADMKTPGMVYTVLATADGEDQQEAAFGGVVPFRGDDETPRWIPYFGVEDVDAVVTDTQGSGGSVLIPAADVPDVGRMAWLADPFGAPFAVIKPNPPATAG